MRGTPLVAGAATAAGREERGDVRSIQHMTNGKTAAGIEKFKGEKGAEGPIMRVTQAER